MRRHKLSFYALSIYFFPLLLCETLILDVKLFKKINPRGLFQLIRMKAYGSKQLNLPANFFHFSFMHDF